MDILDALSFRLMVLDHIKKTNPSALKDGEPMVIEYANADIENIIKNQLSKEINRLIF